MNKKQEMETEHVDSLTVKASRRWLWAEEELKYSDGDDKDSLGVEESRTYSKILEGKTWNSKCIWTCSSSK